jgi:type I restriction-modification system DNA methylase subunit
MKHQTQDQLLNNKHKFAEVFTPPELVKEILEKIKMIETKDFETKDKRIYEPGVGKGAFLKQMKDFETYDGCEINPTIDLIDMKINDKINIFEGDFFQHELKESDLIIGNPPFYKDGFKGPPTAKTRKGTTIWPQIVKRCWEHLAPNGILAMVLPCIWLKPDKEKIYNLFTEHQILYLRVYTCVESNKLFNYKAQTPCCYVIVQKKKACEPNIIQVYDQESKNHSRFVSFTLKPGYCIPTQNAELIQSFIPTMKLNPIKIAYINKEIETTLIKEPKSKIIKDQQLYPLITTYKDTIYGYESTQPGKYQGIPKIIMAHKTFPILFLDKEGIYGLYGRDKFVFTSNNTGTNDTKLLEQYEYLSQSIVQKIIKSFTVRMNFIEKDIFKYLSL